MDFEHLPKQDTIPPFDPHAIAVKYLEYDDSYDEEEITEDLIAQLLQQIPDGIELVLYLDADGEDDMMEVLCDGTWLALGFSHDFGQENFYCYNPAFADSPEHSPLLSGGQSPVLKENAIQDLKAGVRAVEYFIRTGQLYPGINWVKQL